MEPAGDEKAEASVTRLRLVSTRVPSDVYAALEAAAAAEERPLASFARRALAKAVQG